MSKMKKTYAILWAILLVLFNVIAFVAPGWTGVEKYTPSFWIGYVFITLSFIGQLICALIALKEEKASKLFYNIPLITVSYTGLIVSFVVGGACMLISPLPYWIGIIVCAIALAVTATAVIKAGAAAGIVSAMDDKIKAQTFFIKSLTVDAEILMAGAVSDEAKAACKKVYEAIRYSDPMSNDLLAADESRITLKFAEFADAVKNNTDSITALATDLLILVDARNKKCKLLK